MYDWKDWSLAGWTLLVSASVAGVLMGPRRPRWMRLDERWRPALLLLLGVVCVASSTGGRWDATPAGAAAKQGVVGRVEDALFMGFQALTLTGNVGKADGLLLRIGRVTSVAVLVLVGYEATLRLFAEQMRRRRLGRNAGHVVICGLGRIGNELVRELRDRARPPEVVVIERDPANVHLALARQAGAEVVIGDATDKKLLDAVRAARATDVFVITGSNEPNLEAAANVLQSVAALPAVSGRSPASRHPRLLVHLTQSELDGVLQMSKGQLASDRNVEARSFNAVDRAIRKMIEGPLTERRPKGLGQVGHYVVVGFGDVARQLTLRLAELAHFENFRRPRMTIVYHPSERAHVDAFRATHPRFASPADRPAWSPDPARDDWGHGVRITSRNHPAQAGDVGVCFVVNGGFVEHAGGVTGDGFVDPLVSLCRDSAVVVAVFVCRENDEVDCAQSMTLREELDSRLGAAAQSVTLYAYVPRRPVLTRVLSKSRLGSNLILFGDCADSCTYDDLTMDLIRPLAESIADDFDEQYDVPVKPFADRGLWQRRANLMAAAHLNVKLSAVGLQVVPREPGTPHFTGTITKEAEGTAARMEHNRWMAERLLSGWAFGAKSTEAGVENQRRHQFVDWDNLPDKERDKDHDQVSRTIRFCRDHEHFQLVKVAPSV